MELEEIKFKEFEDKLRDHIEGWLRDWVGNNADFPDEYPMQMPEAEWWEQFIVESF